MGNFASILSSSSEPVAAEVSIGKIGDATAIQTPIKATRFRHDGPYESQPTGNIDPRSPTVDIDRTPIVLENPKKEIHPSEDDPRSPTIGITRTPVALGLPIRSIDLDWNAIDAATEINKETEQLVQVLNFNELGSLSSIQTEEEASILEPSATDTVLPVADDVLDFSVSNFTASTPAPSPVKLLPKIKEMIDKENSIVKNQSPSNLTSNRRIPFGEVNRSVTSSPRVQLQNRQKLNVRTVIQGNSIKID